jgi:WD40 repeat protein
VSVALWLVLAGLAKDPLLAGSPYALRDHTDAVTALTFSPDGTRLATAGHDDQVRVWSLASGDAVLTLTGPKRTIASLSFSADGNRLAAGDASFQVHVWDVKTGTLVKTFLHPDDVAEVALSHDGAKIAVAGQSGTGAVYSVADGKSLATFRAQAVRFSHDGATLLAGARAGEVLVLDAKTGAVLQKTAAQPLPVDVACDAKDTFAVSWTQAADSVRAWRLPKLEALPPFPPLPKGAQAKAPVIVSAALSADGRAFATASSDHLLRVWDVAARTVRATFPIDRQGFVALSPDARWVALGDGPLVKLWSLEATDAGR